MARTTPAAPKSVIIFSRCGLQEDILTLLDDEFGREYELDVPWNAVLAESYLYR